VIVALLLRDSQGFIIPGNCHDLGVRRLSGIGSDDVSTIINEISGRIREELQAKELEISSATDDPNGMHVSIFIVSETFEKQNRVKRQQSVYRLIKDEMNAGIIHAVDELRCLTPSEFQSTS